MDNVAITKLAVTHSTLTVVRNYTATTNSIDSMKIEFEFRTDEWNNLDKIIVFTRPGMDSKAAFLHNGANYCMVPMEILASSEASDRDITYKIGVLGINSADGRIPTNYVSLLAHPSCFNSSVTPSVDEFVELQREIEAMYNLSPTDIQNIIDTYCETNHIATKEYVDAAAEVAEQNTNTQFSAAKQYANSLAVNYDPVGTTAAHNVNSYAHADIRTLIQTLTNRLNELANSDDTSLNQLAEIVAYIKNNKRLIDIINGVLPTKVDKVEGKELSTNDYTDEEKNKLDRIEHGAQVNVQPDWNQNDNTSDDYIKNRPLDSTIINTYERNTVPSEVPNLSYYQQSFNADVSNALWANQDCLIRISINGVMYTFCNKWDGSSLCVGDSDEELQDKNGKYGFQLRAAQSEMPECNVYLINNTRADTVISLEQVTKLDAKYLPNAFVNISYDESTDTYSADKTFIELKELYDQGQTLVAIYNHIGFLVNERDDLRLTFYSLCWFNEGYEECYININRDDTVYLNSYALTEEVGYATENKIGFVQPLNKTDEMEQPVGIDENGKLYAKNQLQSDWSQTDINALDYIKNKPLRYVGNTIASIRSAVSNNCCYFYFNDSDLNKVFKDYIPGDRIEFRFYDTTSGSATSIATINSTSWEYTRYTYAYNYEDRTIVSGIMYRTGYSELFCGGNVFSNLAGNYRVEVYLLRACFNEALIPSLNDKVDKINGKMLSTNDYTNEEKSKLANMEIASDEDILTVLNDTDMMPVVADNDDSILTDENGNILLW